MSVHAKESIHETQFLFQNNEIVAREILNKGHRKY